jgi:bla regulator protein blaR1
VVHASLKFFVPFALFMSLGSQLQWTPAARTIATPAVSSAIEQVAEPFPETITFVPLAPATSDWRPIAILSAWAVGFAVIAFVRLRGWLRISAAIRSSVPIEIPSAVEVRSSPGLLEPGVVGVLRPILLLPAGIADRLTPPQLEAVLAHELCHIRRRDNFFASLHMIVEALFWFHPLVWWIGARLVEERERACDEEVLSLGGEPHVYAEAILNVCKLYVESPLVCVSGVTGSDLKKRIEAIMTNRMVLRLNFAKKVALTVAALVALAAPFMIGMLHPLPIKAQSPPAVAPILTVPAAPPITPVKPTPAPKLIAQQTPPPKVVVQPPPPPPIPTFDAVSVKPCAPGDGAGKAGGRGGRGGPDGAGPSPVTLSLACQSVKNLIRMAYVNFAPGHPRTPGGPPPPPIEGGPSWIDSDRFKIDAKAESAPGQDMMRGPMLQALLEDRFKLTIRHETKEVPVYVLTVAKSGPKLQATQEGTCIPFDIAKLPRPGQDDKLPTFCNFRSMHREKGETEVIMELHGTTLDEFAGNLGNDMDRIVINKTGIAGKFEFSLKIAPDETTPGFIWRQRGETDAPTPDPSGGLSIFTAIQQQLGLKLDSAKGSREFLIIDRVEKPSEN